MAFTRLHKKIQNNLLDFVGNPKIYFDEFETELQNLHDLLVNALKSNTVQLSVSEILAELETAPYVLHYMEGILCMYKMVRKELPTAEDLQISARKKESSKKIAMTQHFFDIYLLRSKDEKTPCFFPDTRFFLEGYYVLYSDVKVIQCSKLLARHPQLLFGYIWRGQAYYHLGRFYKAAADFTKALSLYPNAKDFCSLHMTENSKSLELLEELSEIDTEEARLDLDKKNYLSSNILNTAAKLNELMRKHGLNFNQANEYMLAAANIWLLQGQRLITAIFPPELYLLITTFVIGLSEAETQKILTALNDRIFEGSKSLLQTNFFTPSESERQERLKQITDNHQYRRVTI